MLTSETMALLGDGPIVDTNKNGKNVPELEKVSSVLLHCNVFKMIIYKIADYCILLFQTIPLVSYFLSNHEN